MGEYASVLNSGIFLFQVCSIKIESFAYDKENLLLKWHSPGVEFANVIEIPNLKLEGKKNLRQSILTSLAPYSNTIRWRPISQYCFYCRRLYIFSMLSENNADTLSMT